MKYRIPPRLAHVIVDTKPSDPPDVFLMDLPDGPPLVLRESAAMIWILAAEGGSDVPGLVAQGVGRTVREIGGEVSEYLADLVARGLLERSDRPATSPYQGSNTLT